VCDLGGNEHPAGGMFGGIVGSVGGASRENARSSRTELGSL
jgi:hypothetical protein